jgi:hypothetical protein
LGDWASVASLFGSFDHQVGVSGNHVYEVELEFSLFRMKGCPFWAADRDLFDAFFSSSMLEQCFHILGHTLNFIYSSIWMILLDTILQSISATQAKRFTKFRERKGLIDKDVV